MLIGSSGESFVFAYGQQRDFPRVTVVVGLGNNCHVEVFALGPPQIIERVGGNARTEESHFL